jgi:hemoglobin-like flavoprotein
MARRATLMDVTTKDLFCGSLARCLLSPGFVTDFYQRFIPSSPTVRDKFARTDLAAQALKLERSLAVVGSAVKGHPGALRELAERAESHSRRHLAIKPDMYELWTAAILSAASVHDRDWNSAIEQAWSSCLEMIVGYMIARY